jgi:hypothetical protein
MCARAIRGSTPIAVSTPVTSTRRHITTSASPSPKEFTAHGNVQGVTVTGAMDSVFEFFGVLVVKP